MMTPLHRSIRRALAEAWPDFERDHPNLAAVIDRELLTCQIAGSLMDDPRFRAAVASAEDSVVLVSLAGRIADLVAAHLRGLL